MVAVTAAHKSSPKAAWAARRNSGLAAAALRRAIRASSRAWTTSIPALACIAVKAQNHQHHDAVDPMAEIHVATEVDVSAAALAIWKSVERWRFFRLTMTAMQPNIAMPAPIARKGLRGHVAKRIDTLAMRTTLQPESHSEAADGSGLLCFHSSRRRISRTAGSFADSAAKAATGIASSLQCQFRARMATLKIGVRSIAVAPCSRGRYALRRWEAFAGDAGASVCMPVCQNRTRGAVAFQGRTPDAMRIPGLRFPSQRLSSQRSSCVSPS